jgi:hypothetical protein
MFEKQPLIINMGSGAIWFKLYSRSEALTVIRLAISENSKISNCLLLRYGVSQVKFFIYLKEMEFRNNE